MSRINLENSDSTAQSVSDRLLTLLKTRGPQQASDAGKVLGTTGEAARQQFVKLAKEGLVEAVAETRGVGRPVQLWHLTSAGNARFPDTHADLTVQLLRTVRDKLGEQALDVLIETREQENRINYKQAMIGAAAARTRGAPHRDPLPRRLYGRMASGRGRYLSAGGKSLPDLRRRHRLRGFCRAELSIFTEVLQAQVERAEHILAGSRRCAYRISLL